MTLVAAPPRTGALAGSGRFTVERGRTRRARLLGALLRLPAPGAAVPVALTVTRHGGYDRWARDFGGRRLVTRQRMARGLLVECVGPLRLAYAGTVAGGTLTLTCVRATAFGLPLPRWCAPRVTARVHGDDTALAVAVEIAAPGAGTLLRYAGRLTIEEW